MSEDWKQKHANESEKVFENEILKYVMEEFSDNLRRNPDVAIKGQESAWFRFGLTKVVSYAAQVARAQALGFDPELLRLTPDEGNEAMMRKAQMAVELGKPVVIVEAGD